MLVATFIGDTGGLRGRARVGPTARWRRTSHPTRPSRAWSAGCSAATLAFWCAGLYQDWLSGLDALLLGFLVAITAPVGDLFESVIKRDLEVKDTGRFFGVHGGVLDRLDAVFFTVALTFYAALALGYG